MSFTEWLLTYAAGLGTLVAGLQTVRQFRKDHRAQVAQDLALQQEVRAAANSERHRRTVEPVDRPDLAPAEEAHALTFSFDFGPHLPPAMLSERLSGALFLVDTLTDVDGVDTVAVQKLGYRNPVEILIFIWATQAAIGGIVGSAVAVNAAYNNMRRRNSETGQITSGHRTIEARNQAEQAVYDSLRASVQNGEVDEGKVRALAQIAQSLRGVDYQAPDTEAPQLGPGRAVNG